MDKRKLSVTTDSRPNRMEILVWTFVVFCAFGAFYEQVIVLMQNLWGRGVWEWESRAGLVWGPFAPIYGGGAMLMVLILTWRELKSWQVFVGAALIGGGFEFLVGLIQDKVFHTISWDYSDHFMNFGGYTSMEVMVIWGFLGVILVDILYPILVRAISRIRPDIRRVLTVALVILMVTDGAATILAVGRYYERKGGDEAEVGGVARFCDWAFPDEYLEKQVPNLLRER